MFVLKHKKYNNKHKNKMNIADQAKSILEYSLEKGEGNVRGDLLGWYSDEFKQLWGVRPMLDDMPHSLAYIAIEIAKVHAMLLEKIIREEEEVETNARIQAQEKAEHDQAVSKAMAKSEFATIGDLVQL